MMRSRIHRMRGLTLVEMMLALAVTALVAGAIAGMMSAVSAGVGVRRDARTAMIRANLASVRLGSYVGPARAVLDVDPDRFVLWLNDNRPGGTVHVSEVRWFRFDADQGRIIVTYLQFPEHWSDLDEDLVDIPYAANADWWQVLADLETRGFVGSRTVIDGLIGVEFECAAAALSSTQISTAMDIESDGDPFPVRVTATIRVHQPPNV